MYRRQPHNWGKYKNQRIQLKHPKKAVILSILIQILGTSLKKLPITMQFVKANYGRVIAAGLIDGALFIGFFVCLFQYVNLPVIVKIHPNRSLFFGFILYRFIAILFLRGTPGMRILNLIFLNGEEEETDFKEKLLASIFILYRGVDYYQEVRSYA
jgi:hypothetical protein